MDYQSRRERVLAAMEAEGIRQHLASDPWAVYYLTGQHFQPGERFLGLLLSKDREPVLYVNSLFPAEEDGVRIERFSDGEDLVPLWKKHVDGKEVLGIDKAMPAGFLLQMQEAQVAGGFQNGSPFVDRTRAVKDAEEIPLMREASRINDRAMEQFKTLVRPGVTEREVAASMLSIYQSLGASGYSFPPIVAFGVNAANPHHEPDDTPLREGDAVLFDVGCVYQGYCSDMTRTYFFRREPDALQKRIYNLVREAGDRARALVKPGVVIADLDRTARKVITDGGYGPMFTHRLGHFIGLEDHEWGDVSSFNESRAVPGNIFSIEPGIYDPSALGVRIEDLVLVTEDGCEVLNHLPREIEVIG